MSNALSRLTLISSASPLADVLQAVEKIREQEGDRLEVLPFFTHQLQAPEFLPETLLEQIYRSDAVLFDLRGQPERAVSLVQQALAATEGQNIAFIPVFGGGPSILALARLGEFSMAGKMSGQQEQTAPTNTRTGPGRPPNTSEATKLPPHL